MNLLLRQTTSLLRTSSLVRVTTTSIYFRKEWKTTSPFPKTPDLWSIIPKTYQPYLRLSRLDKPTGSWLLFLPGAWSIAFAGLSIHTLELLGLFAVGTILMRGAGCTINDLWDRNYDRRVERTKTRPIASGEISPRQALIWAGVQLSMSFLILIQLNLPSIVLGITSLVPVIIYPLMKRYTYWPQLFLGLTFNW